MQTQVVPDYLQPLQEKYLRFQTSFDATSKAWKRRHQWSWLANTILTWFTLLIAISGMALQRPDFEDFALYKLMPLFSAACFGLTVLQLAAAPRRQWIMYRESVQKLWKLAMYYRGGVSPFTNPQDIELLRQRLDGLCELPGGKEPSGWQDRWQRLKDFYALIKVPAGDFGDLPGTGLWPPITEIDVYRKDRLRGQQQWFLGKARKYQRAYYRLFLGIGLISVLNFVWTLAVGKAFWVVAGTTALSLMLFAILDFFNLGPLWTQYHQTARDLQSLDRELDTPGGSFDLPDEQKRLQLLIERVEHVLALEFSYWFAIALKEKPATEHDLVLGEEYRPQPMPTAHVDLPAELADLQDTLARHVHDIWASRRMHEGWRPGSRRDEARKLSPSLRAYESLPEPEKEYDRSTAIETLKAMIVLGYRIEKP